MSIKYYANRVQESSTTIGSGNLVLAGATSGYRTFASSIGANNYFTYYIYRTDLPAFEWEVGSGYITSSGGVTQLVRDSVITSSNGTALTIFTSGTKYIEPIIGEDRVNSSFLNLEEKSASFTAPYMPATYIVDSSSSNVTVTLPTVVGEDPIAIGFLLNKTSGNQYEQTNAILISPSGTETINGTSSYDISIRNDYVQIVSVPSQSGWLVLDPIQDSTSAYGNNGNIQFAQNQAFSGVSALSWDTSTGSLSIGGTGTLVSSDIILPTGSQTVVFNEQSLDKDFRVEGSGSTHTLFVDASTNYVGIRTSNPTDPLTIASSSGLGISVQASGSGPVVALYNSSVSGVVSNSNIGSIVFSGLNSSGTAVPYATIDGRLLSNTNGSENSEIQLQIYNAGSQEPVASFSPSGVTLGFNSSNIDGVLIGNTSSNEGNNVTLGYNNSVCGENCVVLGNDMVVSSGTFGGAIGLDHAVSGTNLWVIGGSGISVTGSNATYIGLTDDTYIRLADANNIDYVTQSTGVFNINIKNTSVLSSGNSQQIVFEFVNSSGVAKSGLVLSSVIVDPTSGSEDSRMAIKQLYNGSMVDAIQLYGNSVVIGANSVSGNNIVYGHDNTVGSSGNIVYGKNISVSGSNNIALGHTITASGTNISIFGNNNECAVSGSLGVVIMGNSNTANEDYVLSIGHNNASSGLYSVACGYNNGAHGSYSVGIGSDNTVVANASIAVGRSNNLSNTSLDASIFTCGIGNTASISGSGSLIGHSNELYGSGGFVGGIDCYSSGLNNVVVGSDSRAVGTGNIVLANNVNVTGTNNIVFGSGIQWSGSNSIIGSGSYIKLSTGSGLISSSGSSVSAIGSTINISGDSSVAVSSPSISYSGSSIISTASNNSVSVQNTGISILGPSGIYVSGVIDIRNNAQYMSIHNTGITISSPSGLLNRVDDSRYINIATTGTSIIHSSGIILENSTHGHNINLVNSELNITTTTSSGLSIVSMNGFSESARARVYHDNISLQSSSSAVSINASSGISITGSNIKLLNGSSTFDISSTGNVLTSPTQTRILTDNGLGSITEILSNDTSASISATNGSYSSSILCSPSSVIINSDSLQISGAIDCNLNSANIVASGIDIQSTGTNDDVRIIWYSGNKTELDPPQYGTTHSMSSYNVSGIYDTHELAGFNKGTRETSWLRIQDSVIWSPNPGVNTTYPYDYSYSYSSAITTTGIEFLYAGPSFVTSRLLGLTQTGVIMSGLIVAGGGTPLEIGSLNIVQRSSSSRRYKENIREYDKGLNEVLQINPVYYTFKQSPEPSPPTKAGLIAEDIADIGLEEFIVRDENNQVESINYSQMVALLINAIKELKQEIDELKNK